MKPILYKLFACLAIISLAIFLSPLSPINAKEHENCTGDDHSEHTEKEEDHSGHDHSKHAEEEENHKDHAIDDHSEHTEKEDGHGTCTGDDHSEEGVIKLSKEQQEEIDLTLGKVKRTIFHKELNVSGELILNEDLVVHIVAKVPGIATKVNKSVGDIVKKGEVLATLDSAELGESKSIYYEYFNNICFSSIDLKQAITIEKNTTKAIKKLKTFPSFEELKKQNYGDMGKYRAELLASYSTFMRMKKDYERSKKLKDKNIVSESELLKEKNNFETTQAIFFAKLHEAEFKIKQELANKQHQKRVSEFKLKTAERKLLIIGLSKKQILNLQKNTSPLITKSICSDPSCNDCKNSSDLHNIIKEDNDFSKYVIKSPQKGIIIHRTISKGEKINDEMEIFTIADLSTVWVNLNIPARDIPLVKENMSVLISSSGKSKMGKINLIYPILNQETRTIIARVILENPDNEWKPGMFVTGDIEIANYDAGITIPINAVQNIDGEDVVFIPFSSGYKTIPVTLGKRDKTLVQITSGLKRGDLFVKKGAFELKAVVVTSGQGAHAGHNH